MADSRAISDKSKSNAISAYLMILVSWLFLFNKTNPEINNDYVRWHTKSALLIHLGFLITYIIFISYSLFSQVSFWGYGLNDIIVNVIFLGLLGFLVFGIYKSSKWDEFHVSKSINISQRRSLLDIDENWEITEKEKLSIVLSFVPVIWYLYFWKYAQQPTIIESTRLNITVTTLIVLLTIFWNPNLANLFLLVYIIFVVFIWINLFAREQLIQIKLPEVFSPKNIYIYIRTIFVYMKNYFSEKNFLAYAKTLEWQKQHIMEISQTDAKNLSEKKEMRFPKFLVYVPIINLVFLFIRNTKYTQHITNGIVITLLFIWAIILQVLWYIPSSIFLLFLFPTSFGIWYIYYLNEYRMPLIYDLYILWSKIVSLFKYSKKTIKEKRAEVNEVSFKIDENKNNPE